MSDYRDQEFYTPGDEYRKPEGEFGAAKQTVGNAPEFRIEASATPKRVKAKKSLTAKIRRLCAFMGATVTVGSYVVSGAMFSGAFAEGNGSSGGGSIQSPINYSSFLTISKVYNWEGSGPDIDYDWKMFLRDSNTNEPIAASGTDSTFFNYSKENTVEPYIEPHNAEIDAWFKQTTIEQSKMFAGEYYFSDSFVHETVDDWFPRSLTIKTEEYTYEYEVALVEGMPVLYATEVYSAEEADFIEKKVTGYGMPFYCEGPIGDGVYKVYYPLGFDYDFYIYEGAKPKITDNSTGEVIDPGVVIPPEIEQPTDENVTSDSLLVFWYQYHYYEPDYKNYPERYTTFCPDVSKGDIFYDSRMEDDLKDVNSLLVKSVLNNHLAEAEAFFENNKDEAIASHKQGGAGPMLDVTDWFKQYLNVKCNGIDQRYAVKRVTMNFTFSYTSDDQVYTSSSYEKDGWLWFTDGIRFVFLMDDAGDAPQDSLSTDMLYFAWTYNPNKLDYSSDIAYTMYADTADNNQGEYFFTTSNDTDYELMIDSMRNILDTYVKPYENSDLAMFFDMNKNEHLDYVVHWGEAGYTNPTKDVTSWFPDELTYYAGNQKMHVVIDHVTAYIVDGLIAKDVYDDGRYPIYTSPVKYYEAEDSYVYAYGIEFQVVGTFNQE